MYTSYTTLYYSYTMSKKIYVEYNKIYRLRDELDNILQNGNDREAIVTYMHTKKRKKIDSDYELDNREKQILDFIIDNPGTNKQNIINNLGKSSRVPILNRIKRLEKFGYVIEKINEKNSSSHQLYYNDGDSFTTLFKGLKEFKKSYFLLLDNIKNTLIELDKRSKKQLKIIREDNYTNNKDTSFGDLYRLTEYIILPFKILIVILSFSNFIDFNMKDYNENIILHKFLIFNGFIKDIIYKLRKIFLKISEKQLDKNIYFIENLGREMLPTSIETNINFFAKYNLKETAKDLWNSLWKIISPFLSKLFNFYLEIRTIMEKNSVNNLIKLLEIKQEYKNIEDRYKPYTELRM